MVDNPMYSRREDELSHHHHHHHHRRNRSHATMSSNGSTKTFLDHRSAASSPSYPRLVPPEIRLYPSLYPPPETSRYEPNFMLGYGSLQYPKYPREAGKNSQNKHESRFMSRPKVHDGRQQQGSRLSLYPETPELPRTFQYGSVGADQDAGDSRRGSKGSVYDWHIPRASVWCLHRESAEGPCKDCQWKDTQIHHLDVPNNNNNSNSIDGASICSSINPPPTFTALDNYRPVRPPRPALCCRHCSCGIIFAITTIFSLLVLVLIAAFIIYVEMVLKHQTASAMDRM